MEKNEKLLSVIVPVYNTEKELSQCIESILNQTYSAIELILVDDGSTDNSGKICDNYGQQNVNVHVIHQENAGHDKTVFVGRQAAQGYYLSYVDCDDWIEKDMYEKMINALETEQADVVVCAYNSAYSDNHREVSWTSDTYQTIYNAKDAIESAIDDKIIQNYSWNKVYKMSLWEKIDSHGCLVDDFCSTVETFIQSDKIVCINEPLYNYRQREGSLLHLTDTLKTIQYCYKLFLTYEWRLNFVSDIFPEFRYKMVKQMLKQGVSVYHLMIREKYKGNEKKEIFRLMNTYVSELNKKEDAITYYRIKILKMGRFYEWVYRLKKSQ